MHASDPPNRNPLVECAIEPNRRIFHLEVYGQNLAGPSGPSDCLRLLLRFDSNDSGIPLRLWADLKILHHERFIAEITEPTSLESTDELLGVDVGSVSYAEHEVLHASSANRFKAFFRSQFVSHEFRSAVVPTTSGAILQVPEPAGTSEYIRVREASQKPKCTDKDFESFVDVHCAHYGASSDAFGDSIQVQ